METRLFIRGVNLKEDQAWKELYNYFYAPLCCYSARLIGDETDDPDMHARKHSLLAGKDAAFNARLATYEQKYLAPLGEK